MVSSILTVVAQMSIAPTMFWVYAATALLLVLFSLLVAPYLGIYGEKNIDVETEPSEGVEGS